MDGSLETRIAAELAAQADALGLDARAIRVRYVLNWGGFVNRSYHVTDGTHHLHLKLADEAGSLDGLRRWRGVHVLLSERYAAPRMAGWLRIPETPLEGPVFEHIDGSTPQVRTAALIESIAPLLAALHADTGLAARVADGGPPRPCRDTFANTYLRRFREDLDLVRADPPPFIPAPLLGWMEREIDALDAESATLPAFGEIAATPIHADLWLNNLLVDGERLWVLDWDDLSIGDPALDWATVLGPTRLDLAPADVAAIPAQARTPGVMARLPLYARASLFDWLLDPLADWIAADEAPEHAATVRAEKERLHHAALALYRRMY